MRILFVVGLVLLILIGPALVLVSASCTTVRPISTGGGFDVNPAPENEPRNRW